MQLDHPDYITLVIAYCNEKRSDPSVSPLLASSTPANLREECLNVYLKRKRNGEKEETNTLQSFFSVPPTGKDFAFVIEKSNPDRFRPLQSLIKNKIKAPDGATVELLAWLIDFPRRPFVTFMDVELSDEERRIIAQQKAQPKTIERVPCDPVSPARTSDEVIKETGSKNNNEIEKISEAEQTGLDQHSDRDTTPDKIPTPKKHNRFRVVMVSFSVAATVAGGIYTLRQGSNFKPVGVLDANIGCMYWAEDRYEKMPCNDTHNDRFKLPMDFEKMKSFRRITQIDTISEMSIGKVYYIKIHGGIEYYTSGGHHPVEVTRPLVKLSPYMFQKYLKGDKTAVETP